MRKSKNGRFRAALALSWVMEQTRRSHPHALGIPGWQRPSVSLAGRPRGMNMPRAADYYQTLPTQTERAAR